MFPERGRDYSVPFLPSAPGEEATPYDPGCLFDCRKSEAGKEAKLAGGAIAAIVLAALLCCCLPCIVGGVVLCCFPDKRRRQGRGEVAATPPAKVGQACAHGLSVRPPTASSLYRR